MNEIELNEVEPQISFRAREKRVRQAAEARGMLVKRSMKQTRPYALAPLPTTAARAGWDKKLSFERFYLDELEQYLEINE